MKPVKFLAWTVFFILIFHPFTAAQTTCGKRVIISPSEKVVILAKDRYQEVTARIDTGATYSSMDKALAKKLKLDQRIIGRVKVVNAHGETWRQLIKVEYRIRRQKRIAFFTLADRSRLQFPVLIGRTGLKGFLVDPYDSADANVRN